MPDLMIVNMEQCESSCYTQWYEYGGYEQTINFSERNAFHYCSCLSFKHGNGGIDKHWGKTCKHLRRAHASVCGYHEQIHGAPKVKGTCPMCGRNTRVVRVGV